MKEYYTPAGGLWGPIMGAPYYSPLTQWSNGDYLSATNLENDLAVMTDRSLPKDRFLGWVNVDGVHLVGDTSICVPEGVDQKNPKPGDVVYLPSAPGICNPPGEAYTAEFGFTDRADYADDDHRDDAAGATALDNSADDFTVDGIIGNTGENDVFAVTTAGGTLTASVAVAETGANLDSKLTVTDSEGKMLAENSPPATVADGVVTGLDASITKTVEAGTYYLTVTGVGQGNPLEDVTLAAANAYTNYGSLGNYTLSGSAPAVEVPVVPAPVVTAPTSGATTAGDLTFGGTGVAGASLAITVVDALGAEFTTTTTVATDGTWVAQLPSALAAGDYTVTATQTSEGTVSARSAAVGFTVEAADAAGAGAGAGADGANAGAAADGGSTAVGAGTGADGAANPPVVDSGGNLANTGGDFNFAAMAGLITLTLLLSGGVIAIVAIRQRKQQEGAIG